MRRWREIEPRYQRERPDGGGSWLAGGPAVHDISCRALRRTACLWKYGVAATGSPDEHRKNPAMRK